MQESSYTQLDVEKLVTRLPVSRLGALLSASTLSKTTGLPEHGVPSLLLSDGPHACRGPLGTYVPTNAYPSGIALAASFDMDLLYRLGEQMSHEAKAKRAHVVLGPTVNIVRFPLAGRGFEFFGEDPYLSGKLAASYVRGLQDNGVAACMKHFVCNEQEYEKHKASSDVSPRALREIYLEPFRIAVREASPKAFMTAYNPLNGVHCSENEHLLHAVLRDEWQWRGLVMSDWGGTHSTALAIKAGVDLEMPAPTIWRTARQITSQVECGKIDAEHIRKCARNVIELANFAIASGIPFADDHEVLDTPASRILVRESAAKTVTLLKNDRAVLPLDASKLRRITVIGDCARMCNSSGGGSASVPVETFSVSPLDAIVDLTKQYGCMVTYCEGVRHYKYTPSIDPYLRHPDTDIGQACIGRFVGWKDEPHESWKNAEAGTLALSNPAFTIDHAAEKICFLDSGYGSAEIMTEARYVQYTTIFSPDCTGDWEFGFSSVDQALVFLDGKLVLDYSDNLTDGTFFYCFCHEERRVIVPGLQKGRDYKIEVRTWDTGRYDEVTISMSTGFRLGAVKTFDDQAAITNATELAVDSDATVVIVGLNKEYETEGYDRSDMYLPGATDQLIEAVLAVKPDAIIVTQSGMPIAMPWIGRCSTLIHQFYGGTGAGQGLADVLFGEYNPSAKLPVTFPRRIEDSAVGRDFGSLAPEQTRVEYTEDVLVGYRHFDHHGIEPLFPFGHGLSYTTFDYTNLHAIATDVAGSFTVSFEVTNTGSVTGVEVSMIFVSDLSSTLARPVKELKGFASTEVRVGESRLVSVDLDRWALGYWRGGEDGHWVAEAGDFEILVGGRPDSWSLRTIVTLDQTLTWRGS